jgi:PleD family two-component response regulator
MHRVLAIDPSERLLSGLQSEFNSLAPHIRLATAANAHQAMAMSVERLYDGYIVPAAFPDTPPLALLRLLKKNPATRNAGVLAVIGEGNDDPQPLLAPADLTIKQPFKLSELVAVANQLWIQPIETTRRILIRPPARDVLVYDTSFERILAIRNRLPSDVNVYPVADHNDAKQILGRGAVTLVVSVFGLHSAQTFRLLAHLRMFRQELAHVCYHLPADEPRSVQTKVYVRDGSIPWDSALDAITAHFANSSGTTH